MVGTSFCLSVDEAAQLPLGEWWCRDDPRGELVGDPGEDLGVLGAVGLQLAVATSYERLDRLRVERDDVLDDPGGLRRRQPRARHQVGDEGGISWHEHRL